MTTAEPVTHHLTSNAHASASDNYEADLARMKEDLTNMLKAKLGLDMCRTHLYQQSIHEYFKRFKDIKNRCFNLSISEKDLADLALVGLHSHFREKLEGFDYFSINQLQVRALGQAYRFKSGKDTYKTHRSNTHVVEYDYDSSDDEGKDVYAAEFVWPSSAKPCSCSSLKSTQKNQQDEEKFTFEVSRCDRIFYELLRLGHIKL